MLRVFLIRHGQTQWNFEQRYQGQTDIPLTELGRRQAEAVGRRLAAEPIEAIYASDLQRAYETAAPLARYLGLPVLTDERLREVHFGAWEGYTFKEVEERYPEEVYAWLRAPHLHAPPGGESGADFIGRVRSFWEELRGRHPEGTVAIFAHGGSLVTLTELVLKLPYESRWKLRLSHGGYSELMVYDQEWAILSRWNDTCHLDGVEQAGAV